MSETERLKRSDPERIRPHRSFARVFGPGGALSPRGPAPAAEPAETQAPAAPAGEALDPAAPRPRNAVEHGVALGYRVIDAYIDQAQRFAQRLRPRSTPDPESPAASADPFAAGGRFASEPDLLSATTEQAMGSLFDAASLWLEWLQSTPLDPAAWMPAAPWAPQSAARPDPTGGGAGRLELRVVSSRPARVWLELAPGALAAPLRVAPAHGGAHAAGAFAGAHLHVLPGGERVALALEVPDGLAAGAYTAAVVNAASGAPVGALHLEVRQRR
ncbi:MAG TPA: hypothetical protein VMV46_21345 [Thermoanaerobaculia bacterium]|nr:hypothetical protein [Thermoanaerobaculia bacterium]